MEHTAAALGRWKIPQTRSGRRPISVTRLLAKEKDGTLFKTSHTMNLLGGQLLPSEPYRAPGTLTEVCKVGSTVADQATLYFRDGDDPRTTGAPARLLRKSGEGPTRDEVQVTSPAKPEQRQDGMSTPTLGSFASPEGISDIGKFARALETLGEYSRTWEPPTRDESQPRSGMFRAGIGGLVEAPSAQATSEDQEVRGPFRISLGEISSAMSQDEKEASVKLAFQRAFIDELSRHWSSNAELEKEAFLGAVGRGFQQAAGRLRPAAGALRPAVASTRSSIAPEVAAFKKSPGLIQRFGKDLASSGKQLAHNPQTAGAAAGLGAKDLGALQRMRPTSAGRRIAGETAHGAGHHLSHASHGVMALNPVGVPMGGAIEGFSRGVGKELQGVARKPVQAAGRFMEKHAPKIGLGGELLAGGMLHTPGLAAQIGHAAAPSVHAGVQHLIGAGAQEAYTRAPKLIPRMARTLGVVA